MERKHYRPDRDEKLATWINGNAENHVTGNTNNRVPMANIVVYPATAKCTMYIIQECSFLPLPQIERLF